MPLFALSILLGTKLSHSITSLLMTNRPGYVRILEPLRGIAAFSVMWFHFTNRGVIANDVLTASGSYGWLGVEVFFVISGFILPYSMWRGGYRVKKNAGIFVLKRIIRLDPPYIVTIGLTIGLWYLSALTPGFQGNPPDLSIGQLLAHLGYLNAFLDYAWLSPVFWTLAIEFQYYILIAVLYPLIAHDNPLVRSGTLVVLALTALVVPNRAIVFSWMGLFAMGICTFMHYTEKMKPITYYSFMIGLAPVLYFSKGTDVLIVGVCTSLLIAHLRLPEDVFGKEGPGWARALGFLGTISYSLYLIHVPIGGRVINLASRLPNTLGIQILTLLAATTVGLTAAYLMYRFVEEPAKRWSSGIRYRREASETSPRIASE